MVVVVRCHVMSVVHLSRRVHCYLKQVSSPRVNINHYRTLEQIWTEARQVMNISRGL